MKLPHLRTPSARYGVAAGVALASVAVRWLLLPVIGPEMPLMPLFPGLVLAAVLGGTGPGLFAAAIELAFAWFLFLPGSPDGLPSDVALTTRLVGWITGSIGVSLVSGLLRRAILALEGRDEELRASHERLRLAAAAGDVGFFDWDAITDTNRWSEELHRLYGLTSGCAVRSLSDWLERVLPDDRLHLEAVIEKSRETGVYECDFRILRPDTGEVRWMHARGEFLRDEQDRPARLVGMNVDITNRRRAEEALRSSEATFRVLVENAPDAVFIADQQGTYVGANANATKLLGWTKADLIGKRIAELIRPDELSKLGEGLADLREGKLIRREWDLLHKDGRYIPTEMSSAMLPDGRMLGFARDISQRRETEDALRASEAHFREMADTAPAMLWITQADGACVFLSRGWFDFTGQTEEDGLDYGWTAAVHPADRSSAAEEFAKANGERRPFRVEYRLRRADGEYRWAIDAGRPRFSSTGEFEGMIGSVIDVHERWLAQERLELATVAAGIGVFEWRPDGDVIHWENERMYEMFGRARSDGPITQREFYELVVHPEDADAAARAFASAAGKPSGNADVTMRCQVPPGSGLYRWMEFHYAIEQDGADTLRRLVGVVADVTARKEAEAATNAARSAAEAANRAKDEFLAALSHELRTPLNPALILAGEQAQNPELASAVREDFALIRKNIELEARLIDDLLDLTRIARGKVELKCASCDIHGLLKSCLAILQNELARKGLKVQTDFTAPLHYVNGDAVRLQQVFWNVLRNAVRFTPEGGTVSVRTGAASAGCMRIAISDSGVGINTAELETIFDNFEQGTNGRHMGGLGLGLSISRSLVERHGGRIHAESAGKGTGATFVIELPAVAAPAVLATTPSAAPAPGDAAGPLRILLVEDHDATRQTLTRLLERRGHTVTAAGTLHDARTAAERSDFDLLVSDLGLPDGDGCELMREFAAAGAAPGIAISGFGMDVDLARSRDAGFSAHLIKPVDIDALDRALAHYPRAQQAVTA